MKRLIAFSFAFLAFFSIPLAGVSKWTALADQLEESVFFLESYKGTERTGSCTAFMIDNKKMYVLTAAHCDDEKILVAGSPTYKVFKDERKDLMVLRGNNIEGPNIKLAVHDPERGDEVASMGYGFGLEDPMFRVSHISNTNMYIESLSGPFNMIDAGFIGGQSGGPVINDKGELVMIVQRGNDGLGIGIGTETIKDRVGKFFAKE